MILEVRFFDVRPGMRDEFDQVSRKGTIPLMRRLGIDVVAFGPMLNDDAGWCLIRSFASEEDRVTRSGAMYETAEWKERFDAVVPPMIASYRTAVLPATESSVAAVRAAHG
jgi:hypothetical protein